MWFQKTGIILFIRKENEPFYFNYIYSLCLKLLTIEQVDFIHSAFVINNFVAV